MYEHGRYDLGGQDKRYDEGSEGFVSKPELQNQVNDGDQPGEKADGLVQTHKRKMSRLQAPCYEKNTMAGQSRNQQPGGVASEPELLRRKMPYVGNGASEIPGHNQPV